MDTLGVPPVSATASAGAAEEGFKMSSGIVSPIETHPYQRPRNKLLKISFDYHPSI